jgi:hypothetical protein
VKRKFLKILSGVSCFLCLATCALWLRSLYGVDEVWLNYDRYLTNGRAASNAVYLTSERRLWLTILRGSFPPYNGQLVSGYHINAQRSKGMPQIGYYCGPYAANPFSPVGRIATDERGMSGWGPVRWRDFRRSGNGERFRSFTIGVSHWLLLTFFQAIALPGILSLYRSISNPTALVALVVVGNGPLHEDQCDDKT